MRCQPDRLPGLVEAEKPHSGQSGAWPGRWRDSNRRTVEQGCQRRHGSWFAGSKGRRPLVRVPQGRNAFVSGVRGGQPLGRTTSGGESRDSKGRLWSPFSAEHRLRCITALFVPISLRPEWWPSRGLTGSDLVFRFAPFRLVGRRTCFILLHARGRQRTNAGNWLSEPISARLKSQILL